MSLESLATKEPGDTLVRQLGNSLLHTYYASFRLAQGWGEIQEETLKLAAYYYRAQHQPKVLQEAHEDATEKVGKLVLPPGHAPQYHVTTHLQFIKYWKYFGDCIPTFRRTCSWRDPVLHESFSCLVGMTAERDVSYLQLTQPGGSEPYAGRPVGATGRDPRQSFVRDYILEGQSIRDDVLDHILRDAGSMVVSVKPGEGCSNPYLENAYAEHFGEIAALWELHHPQQQFIDPAAYIGSRLLESVGRPTV